MRSHFWFLCVVILISTSSWAQEPQDLEMSKAMRLLTLASQINENPTEYATLAGLGAGSITYLAMYLSQQSPTSIHRPLNRLSDLELITLPDHFAEVARIRHTDFTPEPHWLNRLSQSQNFHYGSSQKKLPGKYNPILQSFEGVNQLFDYFDDNLHFIEQSGRFTFYDHNLSESIPLTSDELRKLFYCFQYLDFPSEFNQRDRFKNLLETMREFGVKRVTQLFELIQPEAFDAQNYPKLQTVLSKFADPKDFDMIALEENIKGLTDFSGRWPHEPQLNQGFKPLHEQVIRNRIRTNRWARFRAAGVVALLVGAIVYLTTDDSSSEHTSIFEKMGTTYDDFFQTMLIDPENYHYMLTQAPEFKKMMAQVYDRWTEEIQHSQMAFDQLERYVSNHPELKN